MSSADYRLAGSARIRRVGDEAIIVDIDRGLYYSLNESATIMVEGLVAGLSKRDIVSEILAHFGSEDESRIANDIDSLVASLVGEMLLAPLSN